MTSEFRKVKLRKTFAEPKDKDGFTELPAEAPFKGKLDDRRLDKGKSKDLEIEFKQDVEKDYGTGDFQVTVWFDDGTELRLHP